ncbi:hypothetical protein A2696_00295 [Candidatus Curtissbacteria bacterium RIFCSPHIGHO2_01_FULL_41_13]|uniref:Membrane protein 6-pyruvoyl-tetrahydropterin synthase-related domain-containing protein n=1 Tax=Candidatus Curtissbacteria bacterium RIFCSPHIGHO2_01_FULL_41_13 TaxID=1797745 RepID=A0A1F5G2H4_9BACT|nr:MAG: hypothetical protein A2696_00295 [Candidatus Curtissbacteria bacterium RIFCSPHIGHO2_01_FULL_41_13]
MNKKIVRISFDTLSLLLHLGFIALVVYFVWPILALYWNQKPAVGIDLFVSVDFVTYIRDHFNWPFFGWKYIWYGGTPLSQTYPLLHFYLIQPLLAWFSAVQAVQVYVLSTMVLFFIFSYLFYYSLSNNRGISAVLSVATAYSYNLWSALYWAGTIPYIATMFLLPLTLYLVVLANQKGNNKFIYFAGLLSGIFILGHPQSFIAYTVPLSGLMILFYGSKKVKILSKNKFISLIFYGLIILLVGFPFAGVGLGIFSDFFKLIGNAFSHGASEITQSIYAEGARQTGGPPVLRMLDIYKRTNPLFFWAMGISFPFALATTFFTLLIKRRASHVIKLLLPFFLMFIYLLIFIYAFVLGLNPLSGGWFRIFWPTMTIFGALAAVLWRVAVNNMTIVTSSLRSKLSFLKYCFWTFNEVIGVGILVFGLIYLKTTYKAFENETLRYVELSSTLPPVISTNLDKGQWPSKIPKLVPDWLNPNELNYRLYDMDATFNIWWNSLYKMPLARGYLDAGPSGPSAQNYAGWQYLQNVVFGKNEAVERWGYSEEQAKAMSVFLIDWNAIKYFEGMQTLARTYGSNPSSYIIDDADIIKRSEQIDVNTPVVNWDSKGARFLRDGVQELKYYEVSEASTSPIYMGSNAPSILVIGDYIGQDIMMRDLGILNFNSRRAIIVQWNKPIDSLSQKELAKFDVVVAYRYKYKNYSKAFKRLENYVMGGGNLFIDTGTEQKESVNQNLLSVFPFEQSNRKELGKDWDFKIENHQITNGIAFDKFSEPVFDDAGWNFSYPETNLKEGAKTLISNHKKPVLVSYGLGKGKIVWSGMNFAGHVQRFKNPEEIALFKNIFFYFGDFSKDRNMKVTFDRLSPEKVVIKGQGAKAVLFKESAYSGWVANARGNGFGQKLTIYEAGPMVPGYMYVFLPEKAKNGPYEVTFKYRGEMVYKMTYLVSLISTILVLDILFFKSFVRVVLGKGFKHAFRRVGKWWEKEDEI